jgi:phosphosulfolactate phosphohydrolase-like enzyme
MILLLVGVQMIVKLLQTSSDSNTRRMNASRSRQINSATGDMDRHVQGSKSNEPLGKLEAVKDIQFFVLSPHMQLRVLPLHTIPGVNA